MFNTNTQLHVTTLTDGQLQLVAQLHAKWKDTVTVNGELFWNLFFMDCMEYTVEDAAMLKKYLHNVDELVQHVGATDMQDILDTLGYGSYETLAYVDLERSLLMISKDKRALANAAYNITHNTAN